MLSLLKEKEFMQNPTKYVHCHIIYTYTSVCILDCKNILFVICQVMV